MRIFAQYAAGLLLATGLTTAALAVDLPGCRPDGSILLPNQWSLRPAGRQVELGDFPVNIALHPAGRFAAVLHCGHGPHEIMVVDLSREKVVSREPVREAFYGIAFSPDGSNLYCSGAGDEVVHVFDFKDGKLTVQPDIRVRDSRERGIPCGLAVSRDGRDLFVANVWGQSVSRLDLLARTNPADIFFTPPAGPSDKLFNTAKPAGTEEDRMMTKRAEAPLDPAAPDAPFPYACLVDSKRGRLYVSLWAQSCVAVMDLKSLKVLERWATEEHPNEMALTKSGRRLFVANANRNTVTVIDTSSGRAAENLDASLFPAALPGSTPNSLALSPDDQKLFVANACNNNVAVFDVSAAGHSRPLGFIPVGWYPTSVRVTPDGTASARGQRQGADFAGQSQRAAAGQERGCRHPVHHRIVPRRAQHH